MSFDLAFWDAGTTPSLADVKEKYVRFCESEDVPEKGTGRLPAFLAALGRLYPPINGYPENRLEECPWACPFESSADFVLVCMRWGVVDALMPILTAMAKSHGLICYDPQEDSVHYP